PTSLTLLRQRSVPFSNPRAGHGPHRLRSLFLPELRSQVYRQHTLQEGRSSNPPKHPLAGQTRTSLGLKPDKLSHGRPRPFIPCAVRSSFCASVCKFHPESVLRWKHEPDRRLIPAHAPRWETFLGGVWACHLGNYS